jgi:hypothetical protein
VLELRCGHRTERSEALMASPNQWACEGEQEREMGVNLVPRGGRKMGEIEGPRCSSQQRRPRGRDGSGWRGRRQQRALAVEVG